MRDSLCARSVFRLGFAQPYHTNRRISAATEVAPTGLDLEHGEDYR